MQILAQMLGTAGGILVLYICLMPLILIHELGHFAAGYACGFHLSRLRVGVVELACPWIPEQNRRFRVNWHWKFNKLGTGEIQMIATRQPIEKPRLRFSIYVLAGPVATLTTAALALPLAMQDTAIGGLAKYFIVVSILLGAGNLIPFSKFGLTSDGGQLWNLLFLAPEKNVGLFDLTLMARLEEIRSLAKGGDLHLAIQKIDQLIDLSDSLPNRESRSELLKLLRGFRDRFVHVSLASAEASSVSAAEGAVLEQDGKLRQ